MASNALDNSQINTLILSTARSDPTIPTNLQHASNYSLDSNTNASTTNSQPEDYTEVNWKRILGYYIPYLTAGRRYRPIQQYRYNIKYGKIGRRYQLYKICYKKKAYTGYIYLDLGTANYSKHILEEYNISDGPKKKVKLGRLVFKQLYLKANKLED